MSMRIFVLAITLFLLVYMTDRHKTMWQKSGRSLVAALVLSVNVLAEMKQLSALSQQLSQYNVDKLYAAARDIVHAFGLSTSSLISLQMFALSTVAMFALLFNEYKRALVFARPEMCEIETKDNKKQNKTDASTFYVMRHACICAKMLN